jgi:lipoyl synthase
VRHKASYERTLTFLRYVREHASTEVFVKSGMMLGLGETQAQVFETLHDLKNAGCDIVTIGQYLQPTLNKLLVKAFITPEEFRLYEEYGHSIGILHTYAGPFIRSSYNAENVMQKAHERNRL